MKISQRYVYAMLVSAFVMGPLAGRAALSEPSDEVQAREGSQRFWRTARNCGLNCLYIMLNVHQKPVSYAGVSDCLTIGSRGSSMADLRAAAGQLGIYAEVVQATPSDLSRLRLPVIAHFEQSDYGDEGHFVVVIGSETDGAVEVLDGTTALRRKFSADEFRRCWSGHLLIFPDRRPTWLPLFLGSGLGCLSIAGFALWRRQATARNAALAG